MRLIIEEDILTRLQSTFYRGGIGLYYNSTLQGVLAYIIFGLVIVFAIIGIITVLNWLLSGKKKKNKDPYSEWIKTGKT